MREGLGPVADVKMKGLRRATASEGTRQTEKPSRDSATTECLKQCSRSGPGGGTRLQYTAEKLYQDDVRRGRDLRAEGPALIR